MNFYSDQPSFYLSHYLFWDQVEEKDSPPPECLNDSFSFTLLRIFLTLYFIIFLTIEIKLLIKNCTIKRIFHRISLFKILLHHSVKSRQLQLFNNLPSQKAYSQLLSLHSSSSLRFFIHPHFTKILKKVFCHFLESSSIKKPGDGPSEV